MLLGEDKTQRNRNSVQLYTPDSAPGNSSAAASLLNKLSNFYSFVPHEFFHNQQASNHNMKLIENVQEKYCILRSVRIIISLCGYETNKVQ